MRCEDDWFWHEEDVTYDALSLRMDTIRSASQRKGKLYSAICIERIMK